MGVCLYDENTCTSATHNFCERIKGFRVWPLYLVVNSQLPVHPVCSMRTIASATSNDFAVIVETR